MLVEGRRLLQFLHVEDTGRREEVVTSISPQESRKPLKNSGNRITRSCFGGSTGILNGDSNAERNREVVGEKSNLAFPPHATEKEQNLSRETSTGESTSSSDIPFYSPFNSPKVTRNIKVRSYSSHLCLQGFNNLLIISLKYTYIHV